MISSKISSPLKLSSKKVKINGSNSYSKFTMWLSMFTMQRSISITEFHFQILNYYQKEEKNLKGTKDSSV